MGVYRFLHSNSSYIHNCYNSNLSTNYMITTVEQKVVGINIRTSMHSSQIYSWNNSSAQWRTVGQRIGGHRVEKWQMRGSEATERGAKLFFPLQFRTPSTNSFAYSQSETALVNIVLICIQPIRDRTCQYRTLTHWARAQLAALLAYLSEIILSWPHTASWQQAMASWIMYIFQCPTVSL